MRAADPLAFLAGDSVMARLMRELDWKSSPLGPPRQWPQSLRSVVNLVLGSAFPMFVAWGPQLAQLYNDAYMEVMGDKHPGGLGQPLLEVWAEISNDVGPLAERALRGDSQYLENMPLRLRRGRGDGDGDGDGDGEDTWFTFSYSPVQDDNGVVAGIFCACIETTKSVLAQGQFRAQQQSLETIFQQAPGFAAVLRGPDHVYEMVNEAYRKITGNRPLIGRPVAEALPELAAQGFLVWLDRVRATGEPFAGRSVPVMLNQLPGTPPVQAFLDFVYQPLKDAAGKVDGIFVQGHEVTEQHQAQETLLAFSNSIPAIAWMAAPDGMLQRFNSQWQAYTGQKSESALGRGWTEAVHPDDLANARSVWEAARKGNREWQVDYRLRGADGNWRWFSAHAVPQLDAGGAVLRWFGTTTDIDDSRRTAHSLRDADRQKDEFLATLAHELRNPLAPIRTAVQLLTAPASTEGAKRRATEVIGRQVGHMARLLDDLIDIARITQRRLALQHERIPVQSLVDAAIEAARPLADAKGHSLVATVADPALVLTGDPVRLAQVLTNLLNNAAKYTDRGGQIGLDVRIEANWVVFAVTDTGIGLTADAVDKVFAMFAQEQSAIDRSEGGLGIGLALVKGLVELHGGSVAAFSEGVGRGSRFVVKLPWSLLPGLTAGNDPDMASGLPPDARTIVLADDNRDAADVMAELLRMEGHIVHTAHDGVQAAELAGRLRPDVVVLDIGMPGMNGYEVAQRIRAQHWERRPLLIAATGWGQEEDRQKALAAGFDRHLTKPFDPKQISALIAQYPG